MTQGSASISDRCSIAASARIRIASATACSGSTSISTTSMRSSRRLRLFSHNRFNLFGLHDRDHGDGRRSQP